MKIAVLSDLHIEFDREFMQQSDSRRRKPKKSRSRKALEMVGHPTLGPNLGELIDLEKNGEVTCHADLVILAGDIDLGPLSANYAGELSDWLGVPLVLIAGNHEFYGGEYFSTIDALKSQSQKFPKLAFLEQSRFELDHADGPLRILGCILWTDFLLFGEDQRKSSMEKACQVMTDFRGKIRYGHDERYLPEHAIGIFGESLSWLQAELNMKFDGQTVVVTHHAPAFRSVPQEHRRDLVSAAYASQLEHLVESSGAALWVHGHMHRTSDYRIGATRVVCNPRGYRGYELNKKFNPGLLIEV